MMNNICNILGLGLEKQQKEIFRKDFRRNIEPVYQQCRESTNTHCDSLHDKFEFALHMHKIKQQGDSSNNNKLQKNINHTMTLLRDSYQHAASVLTKNEVEDVCCFLWVLHQDRELYANDYEKYMLLLENKHGGASKQSLLNRKICNEIK